MSTDTSAAVAGLSTAPGPVEDLAVPARRPGGPARPAAGVTVALRRSWRQLTSMRTALLLLFLLALAAVPGGLLPQRDRSPQRVVEFFTAHPGLAPLLNRLGLFAVYASPWFSAIYLLLAVSLVGCVGPRLRLHARAMVKGPPAAPARLDRLPVHLVWTQAPSLLPEGDAHARLLQSQARTLRRSGWRVRTGPGWLSAEKGYLRETGNLLFHLSLLALLAGIAVGAFSGFKGTVLVKEGEGFANSVFSYDDIQPGRRFDVTRLVPFSFDLRAFTATYGPDGAARTFDAALDYRSSPDAPVRPYDLRVNHPLTVGGARVYLIGHGYAPYIKVTDAAGRVVLDQSVPCLPQNPQFLSQCTVKVPEAQPEQLAFEGVFTPRTIQDPATGKIGSEHPQADRPALTLTALQGDLGLDSGRSQSVYSLDKTRLLPVAGGQAQLLEPGQTWTLPGGATVQFVEVQEWATLQVTQDPGKLLVLAASILLIVGLSLSLSVRRRRLFLRVGFAGPAELARPGEPARPGDQPDAARTVRVRAGGLARTDPERFAAEFDGLVARLGADTSVGNGPDASASGS